MKFDRKYRQFIADFHAVRTLYVALTGSDVTGDGSYGNPYRTLGTAYAVCSNGYAICIKDSLIEENDVLLDSGITNVLIFYGFEGNDMPVFDNIVVNDDMVIFAGIRVKVLTNLNGIFSISSDSGFYEVDFVDGEFESIVGPILYRCALGDYKASDYVCVFVRTKGFNMIECVSVLPELHVFLQDCEAFACSASFFLGGSIGIYTEDPYRAQLNTREVGGGSTFIAPGFNGMFCDCTFFVTEMPIWENTILAPAILRRNVYMDVLFADALSSWFYAHWDETYCDEIVEWMNENYEAELIAVGVYPVSSLEQAETAMVYLDYSVLAAIYAEITSNQSMKIGMMELMLSHATVTESRSNYYNSSRRTNAIKANAKDYVEVAIDPDHTGDRDYDYLQPTTEWKIIQGARTPDVMPVMHRFYPYYLIDNLGAINDFCFFSNEFGFSAMEMDYPFHWAEPVLRFEGNNPITPVE